MIRKRPDGTYERVPQQFRTLENPGRMPLVEWLQTKDEYIAQLEAEITALKAQLREKK